MIKKFLLYMLFFFSFAAMFGNNVGSTTYQELIKKNNKVYLRYGKNDYLVDTTTVTIRLKGKKSESKQIENVIRKNSLGYIDVAVPKNVDIELFVNDLRISGDFECVEYNTFGEYCFIPNDAIVGYQWHLNSINMFNAWNFTKGNSNIKIAVLDSGVDTDHVDLGYGNDGYTNLDLLNAWNYITGTNNVKTSIDHGTFVTGLLAAKTNNSIGIAGVAGGNNSIGVKVIPYCVGVYQPSSSIIDDAIIDAVDNGAKAINISFVIAQNSSIDSAIEYAYNNNVSIVCSTGNGSYPYIFYPASNEYTIAVGANNSSNYRAYFSNFGEGLDLVAPGNIIYSTTLNNSYTHYSGTSFAAPQVSGTIGLLLSVKPDLTPSQIRSILVSSSVKPSNYTYDNNGWNEEIGFGILDVYQAMKNLLSIYGNDYLYNTSAYSVTTITSTFNVNWSLSGSNASNFILSSDTPSLNHCTLTRKDDAEFSSSSGLYLTAQIQYNDSTIKTLTKSITTPYISGPTVPCGYSTYAVDGRPANSTIVWSRVGHGMITDTTFQQTDPMAYNLVNTDNRCIYGLLTAKVLLNNDTVAVLNRRIDTGDGFSGTWYQPATATDTLNSTPQPFHNMSYLNYVPGRKVYLMSDDFIGATVTHSGVLVFHWTNSNGVISFDTFGSLVPLDRLAPGSIVIEGTYPNSCKHFKLTLLETTEIIPFLLTYNHSSGGTYEFFLSEESNGEQSSRRNEVPWQLTIIKSETGAKVYESSSSAGSKSVATKGWSNGVYIATTNIMNQNYSVKFSVGR